MPPQQIICFFKPYGVLSKFTDAEGRPTLADYITVPNVYAAGRLDKDSEGLMLLTNHTQLNARLTEPTFGHPRTYWAQVERVPTSAALQQLQAGVDIGGYITKPATVRLLSGTPDLPPRNPPVRYRATVPTAFIELTLSEGKNRQVRRMTAAVGHPTLRLVRAAIGPISLEGLAVGQWRELTNAERRALYQSVGLR